MHSFSHLPAQRLSSWSLGEIVYERSGKNLFWCIKTSGEVLNKLKSRGFRAASFPLFILYCLIIKEKMIDLIERTFQREGSLYLACNDRNAFFKSEEHKRYTLWSCQKVCEALIFILDNIYIRLCTKLYKVFRWVLIVHTLVADLVLFLL